MHPVWVTGLLESLSGGRACSLGSGLEASSSVVSRRVGRGGAGRRHSSGFCRWHTPGQGLPMLGDLSRARHPALPCSGGDSVQRSQVSVWWACGRLPVLLRVTPPERPHTLSPAVGSTAEGCRLPPHPV